MTVHRNGKWVDPNEQWDKMIRNRLRWNTCALVAAVVWLVVSILSFAGWLVSYIVQ